MSIVNVYGKDVTIRIFQEGLWRLYACAQSCSLTVSTSTVETSTTGSGIWSTFKAQKHSWSGTIEGVVNLDTGNLRLSDLRALQIAMTEIEIRYERVDASGNGYTDAGIGIIVNSSDTGAMDDVATFSIEIQGTGELLQYYDTLDRIITEDGDFITTESSEYIITE